MRESRKHTVYHIMRVQTLLNQVRGLLLERGENHDLSKLSPPEVDIFDKYTPKLKALTYGSDEYKQCLEEMKPALEHHYAHNRHHPECQPGGIHDMSLIDVMEMLADWKAASERHNDGDLLRSIEINAERFALSSQVVSILRNTAIALKWDK